MDLLKKLFGGGGGSKGYTNEAGAMIFYVQPRGCEEVVRVRVAVNSELSQNDDNNGYFVQKMVMGTKCFQRAELALTFDKNKRLTDKQLTGGTLVDEAAYTVWVASQSA